MKKLFTYACLALLALTARAQSSFSDDFESYANGAKIAASSPVWETWSGNVAGEDAPVTIDQAHSGTKSLKLVTTTAAGGPSDVILRFGGAHEVGDFTLDMWMYVVTGKGGYFNLQAEETTGALWTADVFFDKSGNFNLTGGSTGGNLLAGTYPVGQWYNFKLVADLTNNKWEVFVNGVSAGFFANPTNKIASMDLYAYGPTGSIGHYYVDDVSYTYAPPVLPPLDAAMFNVTSRKGGLTGQTVPVEGTIRNTGLGAINSFDVTMSNGGNSQTQSFSGLNITSLAKYNFKLDAPYTLLDGDQEITLTISNVNGGIDDNASNDILATPVKGYTPAPGKAVVVEEATGTWCQWCPRGAVYLDSMSHLYPGYFIGIAVHNSDPMQVDEYDSGLTSFPDFSGFPSVIVNREQLMDPSDIEVPFLESIILAPPVTFNTGAAFDAATGILTVGTRATFSQNLNAEYRLNAVVTEDGVSGTTSDYAQSNAYAGGNAGVMGGFELLPSPVPASLMVYNHVARGILGGFAGLPGSLPASITAGSTHGAVFTYTVDNNDLDKMHIVSMAIGPNGEIVNAQQVSITEALANGLSDATEIVAANSVEIAPNPAVNATNINLSLKQTAETSVRVYNAMGQLVAQRNYGTLVGSQVLPLSTATLESGVYNVQIVVGDQVIAKKVVVSR